MQASVGGPREELGSRPPGRRDDAEHTGAGVPRPEQVQRGEQPAQRRPDHQGEDAGSGSPCRGGHPQQPRRFVREEGQVQGGRAPLQAGSRDQGEGSGQGPPRRCQATEQPGAAVPEPEQVRGSGEVLPARVANLREQPGAGRQQRFQDEEQPGHGLHEAGQVQAGRDAVQAGADAGAREGLRQHHRQEQADLDARRGEGGALAVPLAEGLGAVRGVRGMVQSGQGGQPDRHLHPEEPRRAVQAAGQVRSGADAGAVRQQVRRGSGEAGQGEGRAAVQQEPAGGGEGRVEK